MAKSTTTTTSNLNWREVSPETLPLGLSALYTELKSAQRAASAARDAFETAFTEMANVPSTQSLAFGYRFGKLSFALTDAPRTAPRTPRTSALSFADLHLA